MANVRQYFDSDFKGFFWFEGPLPLELDGSPVDPPVMYRILHHTDSRASCIAFYVPPPLVHPHVLKVIIDMREWWTNVRDNVQVHDSTPGVAPFEVTRTVFTKRVVVYVEGNIAAHDIAAAMAYAATSDVDLVVRDAVYAQGRDIVERPHAFISHDARDKDAIARPLATTLSSNLCRVWYDEFSLTVGDSLRAAIERGLKACHKCVLILTPNFIGNERWAKREYDSVFTREIVEEKQVILPIWSGVTRDQIYEFSPILADRVAIIWDGDVERAARKLLKVLL